MVTREGRQADKGGAMPISKYTPVPTWSIQLNSIKQIFVRLVKDITAYYGNPIIRHRMWSGVQLDQVNQLVIPIVENVKTHKSFGCVSLRIIHAGSSFAVELNGLHCIDM